MTAAPDPLGALEHAVIAEEVASVLRHELRNKLASIRNANYYLARRVEGTELWSADKRVPQFFHLIDDSIAHSEELIDNRWWNVQHLFGRNRGRISVHACLERAAALARVPAASCTVIQADPCDFEVNPDEIALAVRCLVENAAEAMDGHGTVSVGARAVNGRVVITVSDTGAGIPESERKTVFRAFHSTKEGHVGLGFNIAQRLARRNGGEVCIQSAAVGACVALALPIAGLEGQ